MTVLRSRWKTYESCGNDETSYRRILKKTYVRALSDAHRRSAQQRGLHHCIHQAKLTEYNSYGFKASFNPSYPGEAGNPYGWWVSPWHYGINQGPIISMIENYRSGLLWALTRKCRYISSGLRRAGFEGGWL